MQEPVWQVPQSAVIGLPHLSTPVTTPHCFPVLTQ
jgi:hypothetical protein